MPSTYSRSAHARHRVPTRDGWPITLYEYGASADPRPPVLLCHGAFSNHRVYDLGGGFGLAPYLARDGRRVFLVDLRGRGSSAPSDRWLRTRVLVANGWTVDDLLDKDIPAAIEFLCRHTGRSQIDYVGHSMGGMLIAAYLSTHEDPRVRRVVSVGSADFTTMAEARGDRSLRQLDLGVLLAPIFHTMPVIPVGPALRAFGTVMPKALEPTSNAAWNGANVDPAVLRRYLRTGLVTVSSRKLRSFRYLGPTEQLASYRHPTLWLAGPKDVLVAPEVTRRCYERAGSAEKRFRLFAKSTGSRADYGHVDLLIGRYVEQEVFPEIAAWLA